MIHLCKLSLENFMSIESLDIEFSDNQVIMIHGTNGSGKTAMMSAIALALLNYRKGDSYKDFIRTGCETAHVVLDVLYRGDPMHIDILVSNDKYSTPLTRKITFKDNLYNNSECTAFLNSLDIGYLEQVMFFFQKDNSIVDLKSGERAKLLKKLFHFEFDEQITDLKNRLEEEKLRLQNTSVRLEEATKRTFPLTPLLEIPPQEDGYTKKLKRLDELIAAGDSYDASKIELIDEQLSTATTKLQTCEATIRRHEAGIAQKEAALKSFSEKLPPVEVESVSASLLSALNKEKDILAELHLAEQLKLSDENQLLSQIQISKTGVCHACGNKIDHEHLLALEKQLEVVKEDTLAASALRAAQGKLVESKQQEYNAALKVEAAYAKELADYEKLKASVQSYPAVIEQGKALIKALESEQKSLESKIAELEESKVSNAAAREAMKSAEDAKRQRIEMIRASEERQNMIAVNAERERNNAEIVKQSQEHEKVKHELALAVDDASRSVTVLKAALNIFDSEFPNFIILQTCSHVESSINEFVSKIFPYMKVKLSQNRGGVDFYYTANTQEDEWLSVKMASGAEAAILSLAWRVAIANLYGVTTLLLDEVDAEATDENSKYIYEFISSLTMFKQLLLISHRKEALRTVAALADNVTCYEVEKGVYTEVADPEFLD